MKQFTYEITDPVGVHARSAGLLAETANSMDSAVTVANAGGKSAPATKLLAVAGLKLKQGDLMFVTVEGGHEDVNCAALIRFFADKL